MRAQTPHVACAAGSALCALDVFVPTEGSSFCFLTECMCVWPATAHTVLAGLASFKKTDLDVWAGQRSRLSGVASACLHRRWPREAGPRAQRTRL